MLIQIWAEIEEKSFALEQRDNALRDKSEALLDREQANLKLLQSERFSRQRLYNAQVSLAQQALLNKRLARAEDLLNSIVFKSEEQDLRGFEWKYLNQQLLRNLRGSVSLGMGEVAALSFSPDAKYLLACGGTQDDGFVASIDCATMEPVFKQQLGQIINACAYSPIGDSYAYGNSDGSLVIFDATLNQPRVIESTGLHIKCMAWSPDGTRLAVGSERGELQVWSLEPWQLIAKVQAEQGPILRTFFSKDSNHLYTSVDWGGQGKHSTQWELTEQASEAALLPRWTYDGLSLTDEGPDGREVAGMDWGRLVLTATADGHTLQEFPASAGPLLSVRFMNDRSSVLLASRNDREVRQLSAKNLELLQAFPARHTLSALALQSDGTGCAVGDIGGEVRLWRFTDDQLHRLTPDSQRKYTAAHFLPNTSDLLLGAEGQLWTWTQEGLAPEQPTNPEPTDLLAWPDLVAVSGRDGIVVRSKSDGSETRLQIENRGLGSRREILLAYPIYRNCLALSRSGRYLATRGEGLPIDVFDLTDENSGPKFQLDAFCVGIAFSHAEDQLVCGTQFGEVRAFDLKSGQRLKNYCEIGSFWAWGMSSAFSPDDQFVAGGNESGKVQVWKRSTGELVAELTGNEGEVSCLAFFPDGRRLVSCGRGEIRLWDYQAGQELLTFSIGKELATSLEVNQAGTAFLARTQSGRVYLWSVDANGPAAPHN